MQQIGAEIRASKWLQRQVGASCGSMWEFETAMAANSVQGAQGPKFDSYDMRKRLMID